MIRAMPERKRFFPVDGFPYGAGTKKFGGRGKTDTLLWEKVENPPVTRNLDKVEVKSRWGEKLLSAGHIPGNFPVFS